MSGNYRDPDRATLCAEIEVVNRNCKELLLPQVRNVEALNVSHAGQTERFIVYEDDVAKVQDFVETEPELINQARKVWERKTLKMLADKELIKDDPEWSKVNWDNAEIKTAMTGWSLSLEAVFQDMNERPVKPLVSCTVIRTGIVPTPKDDPLARFRSAPVTHAIDAKMLADAVAIIRQAEKQTAQPQPQQNQNRR